MKYYQELTLLPSFEIPISFIWSKVYQQLHLAFVEMQNENGDVSYGVSFPQYQYENGKVGLGEKIRVFADSEEGLLKLGLRKWLERFTDYVHITGMREVPGKNASYAIYRRSRPESSAEQKARRFLMRHKEQAPEYEQAVKMFSQKKREICRLPYIQQKSLTNQHSFRLYVEKKLCQEAVTGRFGTYGLSDVSTVPEF